LVFRSKDDAIILDQDVHKLSQPTATAGHLPEFSQGKPANLKQLREMLILLKRGFFTNLSGLL
jgi:hypothetical protein